MSYPGPAADRSARVDLALSAGCAAALVVVLYAAFLDSAGADGAVSGPLVGQLILEKNEVRRRSEGALAWQPLHASEPLFDRDAVFVGTHSRAVIELLDGATIEVAEGALVVVRRPEPSATRAAPVSVLVVRGTAHAEAGGGGLTVRSGHSQVAVTPGSKMRIQADRTRGAQIDVSAGQAVLASAGADPVALGAGTRAHVEPAGGVATRQQLTVELLHPASGQAIFATNERFDVKLAWAAPRAAADCIAELSDDPRFGRIVAQASGRDLAVSRPGTYWWRVRCGDGQGAHQSEERLLHLVQDVPPLPLYPVAGAVLLDPVVPLTLSWTEVEGASGYELELRSGDGPPQVETPWGPAFRLETALGEGQWCYRVRAQPAGRQTPWSKRICFRVAHEGVLPAPELHAPRREPLKNEGEKSGALDLLWRVVGGVAHAATAPSAIVLRWGSIEGADSYLLEIAEDRGFERLVLQEKVRSTWYRWPTVLRREYFWRVRAVDGRGRDGRISEVVRLPSELEPVTLRSPAAGAAFGWEQAPPQVPLRWEGPAVASSYRLEIATDASFSRVVHAQDLEGVQAAFTPPLAGEFHWRVSARDLEGEPLPPSGPSSFRVVTPAPEPAPQRQRLVAGSGGALAALSWSGRPVKGYELQLSSDGTFARPQARRIVRDQPAARLQLDGPGRFLWRVRGVEPETAWSRVERLLVRPEPPVPLLPAHAATVTVAEGQSAVELRWTEVPAARGYQVELKAASGQRVEREARTARAALEGLPAGSLSWRVRAIHRSGIESDWSEPRTFELLRTGAAGLTASSPHPLRPRGGGLAPRGPSFSNQAYVGLAPGVFHNLAGIWAPRGSVELGWRRAAFGQRVGAALSVGYFRAAAEAAGGPLTAKATLEELPVAATCALVLATPALDLVFSAGPALSITRTHLELSSGERLSFTHLALGVLAQAGVERRLGPGAAFADAGWLQSPRLHGTVEARRSGLTVQAGYRLEVW